MLLCLKCTFHAHEIQMPGTNLPGCIWLARKATEREGNQQVCPTKRWYQSTLLDLLVNVFNMPCCCLTFTYYPEITKVNISNLNDQKWPKISQKFFNTHTLHFCTIYTTVSSDWNILSAQQLILVFGCPRQQDGLYNWWICPLAQEWVRYSYKGTHYPESEPVLDGL